MSKYWDKFPSIKKLTLDLREVYGEGFLEVSPQAGPQRAFYSCHAGMSETKNKRDQDFPLIFYGGAR